MGGPPAPAGLREYFRKTKRMDDLLRLAFRTDSTRLITRMFDSVHSPAPLEPIDKEQR